ncbi:ROK family protein [Acidobacteriota bacterium]
MSAGIRRVLNALRFYDVNTVSGVSEKTQLAPSAVSRYLKQLIGKDGPVQKSKRKGSVIYRPRPDFKAYLVADYSSIQRRIQCYNYICEPLSDPLTWREETRQLSAEVVTISLIDHVSEYLMQVNSPPIASLAIIFPANIYHDLYSERSDELRERKIPLVDYWMDGGLTSLVTAAIAELNIASLEKAPVQVLRSPVTIFMGERWYGKNGKQRTDHFLVVMMSRMLGCCDSDYPGVYESEHVFYRDPMTSIVPEAVKNSCFCSVPGCYSAWFSGRSLHSRLQHVSKATPNKTRAIKKLYDNDELNLLKAGEFFSQNKAVLGTHIEEMAEAFGHYLGMIQTIWRPHSLVLNGELSLLWDLLKDTAYKTFHAYRSKFSETNIEVSSLQERATLLGATRTVAEKN